MWGDQFARQWRIIRAIGASLNELNVTEIAQREETGIRATYPGLEAPQACGFPLYTERAEKAARWAFIDTLKSKISLPTELSELRPASTLLGARVHLRERLPACRAASDI